MRFKIHIYGKVQGVFFRANTERKALSLGIKGIVANRPDGSVYVEAEGPRAQLQQFLAWCHVGDSPARVDKVVFEESEEDGYADFKILR